jgi:hypothetical protein
MAHLVEFTGNESGGPKISIFTSHRDCSGVMVAESILLGRGKHLARIILWDHCKCKDHKEMSAGIFEVKLTVDFLFLTKACEPLDAIS